MISYRREGNCLTITQNIYLEGLKCLEFDLKSWNETKEYYKSKKNFKLIRVVNNTAKRDIQLRKVFNDKFTRYENN